MPVDDVSTKTPEDEADGVFITGDAEKLPADVRAMLDPSLPLPADVAHFETHFDWHYISNSVLIAIGFGLATLVIVPFGVAMLFDRDPAGRVDISFAPLGFGLVCGFVTWFMFESARSAWTLRGRQQRGERTRRGTFLTPAALIQATENDTTIIPPSRFRGMEGRTIAYELKSVRKTFNLSADVVESTPADRYAAIVAWASQRRAQPPPLTASVR